MLVGRSGARLCQQRHFVPRLRLGLVGGRLVSLGWTAPAGLSRILRFIRLLALILGRSLFRGLALRRPIPGSGKIHHFPSGGGISHAGDRGLLLVLARRRHTLLRRSRSVLAFGNLLISQSRLLRRRGRYHLGRTFYHGGPRLGRGGLIMHRGIGFDRLRLFRLGGLARFPSVGNILFIVNHLKTSFVVK